MLKSNGAGFLASDAQWSTYRAFAALAEPDPWHGTYLRDS